MMEDEEAYEDDSDEEVEEEVRKSIKLLTLDQIAQIREQYVVSYPKLSLSGPAKVIVPPTLEEQKQADLVNKMKQEQIFLEKAKAIQEQERKELHKLK